ESTPSKPTHNFKVNQKVKIKSTAKQYSRSTKSIDNKYKGIAYTIQQIGTDDVLLTELYSWVKIKDIEEANKTTTKPKPQPKPTTPTLKVGSKVKIKSTAGKYSRSTVSIPTKHKNK